MAKNRTLTPGESEKFVPQLRPEVAERYEVNSSVESNRIQIAGVAGGEIDLSTITIPEIESLNGLKAVLTEIPPKNS